MSRARARDRRARQGLPLGSRGAPPKPPRGKRVEGRAGRHSEQILYGPAPVADGTANLIGALKKSMATTGYSTSRSSSASNAAAPYSVIR